MFLNYFAIFEQTGNLRKPSAKRRKMGGLFSKRVSASRRPSQVQSTITTEIERQRSFSIYPEDWAGKHYSEVVTFLKGKYPKAHVTTQAEKVSTCDLTFTRPVSFEEGDTHIIVVYNCHNNEIMGFYNPAN